MLSRKPTSIKLTQEDIQDYDNLIPQRQPEHSSDAELPLPVQAVKAAKGKESAAVTAQERQRDMDERIGVGGAAATEGRGGRRWYVDFEVGCLRADGKGWERITSTLNCMGLYGKASIIVKEPADGLWIVCDTWQTSKSDISKDFEFKGSRLSLSLPMFLFLYPIVLQGSSMAIIIIRPSYVQFYNHSSMKLTNS